MKADNQVKRSASDSPSPSPSPGIASANPSTHSSLSPLKPSNAATPTKKTRKDASTPPSSRKKEWGAGALTPNSREAMMEHIITLGLKATSAQALADQVRPVRVACRHARDADSVHSSEPRSSRSEMRLKLANQAIFETRLRKRSEAIMG